MLRYLVCTLVVIGCAFSNDPEPFHTRIYAGSYDEVWLAALKATSEFPMRVSNKDIGKIQSEIVQGPYNELLFTYPASTEVPDRFRYSIVLNIAKVSENPSGPAIRVRIGKELERYKDFYAGWLSIPTDGLEERILLYRIEHILQMEQALLREEPQ